MKKLFFFFSLILFVGFAGCSSDNDDDGKDQKDATWEEIVAYLSELGEFEGIERNGNDENDKEVNDALLRFFVVSNTIQLQADDSPSGSSTRHWQTLGGTIDKNSVSGSIGNLSIETSYAGHSYTEVCKVTFKSTSDFHVKVTSYSNKEDETYVAWLITNK